MSTNAKVPRRARMTRGDKILLRVGMALTATLALVDLLASGHL